MGCAAAESRVAAPLSKDDKSQRGGIKLLEFKVKSSTPGRQFSAEISALGGDLSLATRFANQVYLPTVSFQARSFLGAVGLRAPDNDRWKWLREAGSLHWQGKCEMRPASSGG